MDPVVSWMDVEAVRQMAQQLVSPSQSAEVGPAEDAGFSDTFVGYVIPNQPLTPPQPETESRPPPLPERVLEERAPEPAEEPPPKPFPAAAIAGAVSATPHPQIDPTPPVPEAGTLVRRMESFREWLTANFKARGAFVLDRDGNPVIDDAAFAKLHFLARSLAQAYRPVKGEAGNVHVKVGSDAFLSVVPVDTAFGRLVLGAVLPTPLDAPAVRAVAAALEQVARPVRH